MIFLDKAVELGRLIGQGEEYKALKRAQDAMEAAAELRLKFERMELLARGLEQQAAEGNEPSEAEAEEYNRLFNEVQTDARYQQLIVAQSAFDKVMLKVQQRMMEGMRKGSESSIITLT